MEGGGAVITALEIAEVLYEVFDSDGDGQVIPQEAIDVLESFGNSEAGDNDVEALLTDIKNSLVTTYTDGEETVTMTVGQRLNIIDERLNAEFITVNDCLGLITTCLLSFFSFKILTWFYNILSR